jgi:hypothetical protein
MLLGKFVHKPFDVICLGPNARHDDMTRRMIERATPRAVIVVVDSVIRNGVDLRILGDKIRIERIDGRVRLNAIRVALAQARVELSGFTVREPLIREPHCKITAYKAFSRRAPRLEGTSTASSGIRPTGLYQRLHHDPITVCQFRS